MRINAVYIEELFDGNLQYAIEPSGYDTYRIEVSGTAKDLVRMAEMQDELAKNPAQFSAEDHMLVAREIRAYLGIVTPVAHQPEPARGVTKCIEKAQ